MYGYLSPTLKPVNAFGAVASVLLILAAVVVPIALIPMNPGLWWLWVLVALICLGLAVPPLVLWRTILLRADAERTSEGVLDVVPVIKGDFPHDDSGMERMFGTGWLRFTPEGLTVISNTATDATLDATSIVAFVPYREPLEATTMITERGWAYPRLLITSGEAVLEVEVMSGACIWRGSSLAEVGAVATRLRSSVISHVRGSH